MFKDALLSARPHPSTSNAFRLGLLLIIDNFGLSELLEYHVLLLAYMSAVQPPSPA